MTQPPTLFTLPVELQKNVIDLLPYPTLQILYATHPHFQTLIDFQRIQASKSYESIVKELVIAARSDAFLATKSLFACRDCLRLLPENHFADKQRKNGYHSWFCVKCGLKTRYQPGARVNCMGTPGVYCRNCYKFKQGQAELAGKSQPFCADCLGRRERKRLEEAERERTTARRQERAERNRYRYPSDCSDDTEEETWSEAEMRLVQMDGDWS